MRDAAARGASRRAAWASPPSWSRAHNDADGRHGAVALGVTRGAGRARRRGRRVTRARRSRSIPKLGDVRTLGGRAHGRHVGGGGAADQLEPAPASAPSEPQTTRRSTSRPTPKRRAPRRAHRRAHQPGVGRSAAALVPLRSAPRLDARVGRGHAPPARREGRGVPRCRRRAGGSTKRAQRPDNPMPLLANWGKLTVARRAWRPRTSSTSAARSARSRKPRTPGRGTCCAPSRWRRPRHRFRAGAVDDLRRRLDRQGRGVARPARASSAAPMPARTSTCCRPRRTRRTSSRRCATTG